MNEALACLHQASQRITASAAQRLNHASTYERGIFKRVEEEWMGVIGERALAKWLQAYYGDGINTFHGPDLLDYQVRATRHRDGHLLIRPGHNGVREDEANAVYVLAIVADDAAVSLAGWTVGVRAQRAEWWCLKRGVKQGGRPSWWVPQEALYGMDSLPRAAS